MTQTDRKDSPFAHAARAAAADADRGETNALRNVVEATQNRVGEPVGTEYSMARLEAHYGHHHDPSYTLPAPVTRVIRCDPETRRLLRLLKDESGEFILRIDPDGRERFLDAIVEEICVH